MTLDPDRLTLQAAPGDVVRAEIGVRNEGDDERALTVDDSLRLRAAGALAGGVKSAFKPPNKDFSERLIALGTHLAAAQSISLDVRGDMRDATVPAGGETVVTLALSVPDDVASGTTWTGSMAVMDARLRVRLTAVGETADRRVTRQRET